MKTKRTLPVAAALAALFAATLLLAGCASAPGTPKPTTKPVHVTNLKKIYVLPPGNVQTVLDGQVMLVATFGGTRMTAYGDVVVDEAGMQVYLFSDFGTDLGSLTYDGTTVLLDCALFPEEFSGEYLVNDLQNACYEPDALSRNLAAAKLGFAAHPSPDGGEVREVLDGKKVVEEIFVSPDEITVKNYLRGYEFTVIFAE